MRACLLRHERVSAQTQENVPRWLPSVNDGYNFAADSHMALEQEMATYQNKFAELKAEEGKFVLIRSDEVVGTYTSAEDAIAVGYESSDSSRFW
jgi:hypothetical protein